MANNVIKGFKIKGTVYQLGGSGSNLDLQYQKTSDVMGFIHHLYYSVEMNPDLEYIRLDSAKLKTILLNANYNLDLPCNNPENEIHIQFNMTYGDGGSVSCTGQYGYNLRISYDNQWVRVYSEQSHLKSVQVGDFSNST